MDILFELHSGWRYVVVLATIGVLLYFIYAFVTKETPESQETRFLKIWAGIVDTQVLLGILLIAAYIADDLYYDKLTGHWITMFVAAAVAHAPAIYRRLNGEPTTQVRRIMGIVVPLLFIILVVGGLMAIERGLFERGEAPGVIIFNLL